MGELRPFRKLDLLLEAIRVFISVFIITLMSTADNDGHIDEEVALG